MNLHLIGLYHYDKIKKWVNRIVRIKNLEFSSF